MPGSLRLVIPVLVALARALAGQVTALLTGGPGPGPASGSDSDSVPVPLSAVPVAGGTAAQQGLSRLPVLVASDSAGLQGLLVKPP